MALLFSDFVFLQIPNFEWYFELLSVQYDESIHAPD
jgi:hypothetical protein